MLQVSEGKSHGSVLNSSLGGRVQQPAPEKDYARKSGGVRK
jgi:hypothetical protein